MKCIRIFSAFFLSAALFASASAQRGEDVLATSSVGTYKPASLSPNAQKLYFEQRKLIAETRSRLLTEMVSNALLEMESKATGQPPAKLLAAQHSKLAESTAAEIHKVYDANEQALGGRPLAEVRSQIVEFLKHEGEDKADEAYVAALRAKYKVVMGKDMNTVGLGAADTLVTIGSRAITLGEFEQANRVRLTDTEIQIYEEIRGDLEASLLSALAAEEAKAANIDLSSFIATEITDKLRLFTDEERAGVEADLMRRLFAKYSVRILLAEPKPLVQNISVDDDPSVGATTAPVTVVMFTDFQCPACARTHPALKQAISGYADKVRFVVRDFPLENIHENSFNAALAASAAFRQGKFADYSEVLYRNQHALDKASLVRYAAELGLNVKQFELDFTDAKNAAEVRKDQAEGRRYGIGGTPAIFVNGIKVQRLSLLGFRSAIDRALKK